MLAYFGKNDMFRQNHSEMFTKIIEKCCLRQFLVKTKGVLCSTDLFFELLEQLFVKVVRLIACRSITGYSLFFSIYISLF